MTYNKFYNETKTYLENAIKGNIPNVKAFKANIKELTRRINIVACKMQFATSDEEVRLAEIAIDRLRGTRDAYKDVLADINAKLNA